MNTLFVLLYEILSMKQIYNYSWMMMIALAISINFSFAATPYHHKTDSLGLHLHKSKPMPSKTGLHVALPPLKPASTSYSPKIINIRNDDKLLSNIQIYPNPITDQINMKYQLSRNAIVTIKLMDVLGNTLGTLLSQRVTSGEQTFTYPLNNRLSHGFYFIRVNAGTESVIKRISVL